ncbi:hypothetical protein VR43_20085 [Streptomyces sp. NRRL S-104]|nr:hypothetical protein VR43_20085 [Streptomyces sp. NRRL S-104]
MVGGRRDGGLYGGRSRVARLSMLRTRPITVAACMSWPVMSPTVTISADSVPGAMIGDVSGGRDERLAVGHEHRSPLMHGGSPGNEASAAPALCHILSEADHPAGGAPGRAACQGGRQ